MTDAEKFWAALDTVRAGTKCFVNGKVLTEEKYAKANIQLVINGNIVENPKLPQTFTDWENRKYFPNNVFQRAALKRLDICNLYVTISLFQIKME